jgi:hypothetical protein
MTPTPCCVYTISLLCCHTTYFMFHTDISDKHVFNAYDWSGNGKQSAVIGSLNLFRRYYTFIISYN